MRLESLLRAGHGWTDVPSYQLEGLEISSVIPLDGETISRNLLIRAEGVGGHMVCELGNSSGLAGILNPMKNCSLPHTAFFFEVHLCDSGAGRVIACCLPDNSTGRPMPGTNQKKKKKMNCQIKHGHIITPLHYGPILVRDNHGSATPVPTH
jgi:hypothetical protein